MFLLVLVTKTKWKWILSNLNIFLDFFLRILLIQHIVLLSNLIEYNLFNSLNNALITFLDHVVNLDECVAAFSFQLWSCDTIPVSAKQNTSLFTSFDNIKKCLFHKGSFLTNVAFLKAFWYVSIERIWKVMNNFPHIWIETYCINEIFIFLIECYH